jgi:hypothetical protein
MCVDATFSDPNWVDLMLALCVVHEAQPKEIGWPVGTLIHNTRNGRRGRIYQSNGEAVQIAFDDDEWGMWTTMWDVVLRNYARI